MPTPLRVLFVEDQQSDTELLLHELRRAGYAPHWQRVECEADFVAALDPAPDIVLSDFNLPGWNGLQALEQLVKRDLEIPFILVSGTIGEEVAVTAMKAGACDYLLKDRLARLGSAIAKALEGRSIRQARRLAESRLQRVVASSPAVTYALGMVDNRLASTWISENLFDMMGYSADEALGSVWFESHLHPDDAPRVLAGFKDILTRGHLLQEYRFRHKDGTFHWVRDEKKLVSKPGEPVEIVGSWSDISPLKRVEEQLRNAQRMEAIGQLAGGVAHDFNILLTVILGYSEMMLQQLPSEAPHRSLVAEIRKAGERATSLTRQLLAFSRKQVLAPEILDLNALVTDTSNMLRRLIGEDIELAAALAADLGAVKADPGQIEQILLNLAVNARDAMPHGGKLTIETANVKLDQSYAASHAEVVPGSYVMLAVTDTGCGMNKATQARIFEPFFTTKGPDKGTGLGLATVYGIVKQSNGFVYVYSELGQGTTFKIYLPEVDQIPNSTTRPASDSFHGINTVATILLVEDDDSVRTVASLTLSSCGYFVLEANSGEAALDLLKHHPAPIHLVISDIVMASMNGPTLAKHVAQIRPLAKVLFVSGYTDDAVIRHGVLSAEMNFLQKPFSPRGLAKKVRELLGASR